MGVPAIFYGCCLSLLSKIEKVLDAANLSSDKEMDPVDKWLIITRSSGLFYDRYLRFDWRLVRIGFDPEPIDPGEYQSFL